MAKTGSKFNANSKAKTRCYLVNNDTGNKKVVQFNPTSIPYSRSAKFSEISSPGMSYPLTQYVGGEARSFDFELFYYDKPYSGKITSMRKFLEKLLPPEKNNKTFKRPPTFTMVYGYFVRTYVLVSLEVNDTELNEDGLPVITTFKLSVRQVGK